MFQSSLITRARIRHTTSGKRRIPLLLSLTYVAYMGHCRAIYVGLTTIENLFFLMKVCNSINSVRHASCSTE
jgi:ABC-type transport system involved in cytochrome c biogenesis ATPase subunit